MKHNVLAETSALLLTLLLISCAGTPEAPTPLPPAPLAPIIEPPPPPPVLTEPPAVIPPVIPEGTPPAPTPPPPAPATAQKRVIPVSVESFSFSPATITVKRGEMVDLKLTGISGTHGFAIPGLGINVPVSPGETKMVTIPTATPGTYEGLCSIPCGSGHRDMRFTVTVE